MRSSKSFFCACLFFIFTTAKSQQLDSIYVDSLVQKGWAVACNPNDIMYSAERAIFLQPGITTKVLKGIDGAHLGITIDLGHVAWNRMNRFNKMWRVHLLNVLRLHMLEVGYIKHPYAAYAVRAPLTSFIFAFPDKKGRENSAALLGLFNNRLHYDRNIMYYSFQIGYTVKVLNFIAGFGYSPKPYFRKVSKTYNNYEEYANDQSRLDRIEIRNNHSTFQIKLSYSIRL